MHELHDAIMELTSDDHGLLQLIESRRLNDSDESNAAVVLWHRELSTTFSILGLIATGAIGISGIRDGRPVFVATTEADNCPLPDDIQALLAECAIAVRCGPEGRTSTLYNRIASVIGDGYPGLLDW